MTSIDVETNGACSTVEGPARERRKSMLFCPVCGHESPVDGDWNVTVTDHGTKFACPYCEHVVAIR